MTKNSSEKMTYKDLGWPMLSNRDEALFLIKKHDFQAQLIAIKGMLERNQVAEAEISKNIRKLDDSIRSYDGNDTIYQAYLEDRWVDAVHSSFFQDAAHSMAAIGMLAPFTESLFVSIFTSLRTRQDHKQINDKRLEFVKDLYWNPRIHIREGKPADDLVKGIQQLAISIGLEPFLPHKPHKYVKTLSALFGYRNNMFHSGFEWPLDTRTKFEARIKNEAWPKNWFEHSLCNDDLWIFYMSTTFIEHCFSTIDQVLDGVGRYLSEDQNDRN